MGILDSSLTRVQPVFTALGRQTDPSWVLKLLALGSRSRDVTLPAQAGVAMKPPQFEYGCLAPTDLLQWMITNPSRLEWKALESTKLADETVAKRKALRDGEPAVMAEALELLRTRGGRPGGGCW